MNQAFLEVGALFEERWTGIPNVVAAIAERALRDPDIQWSFAYDAIDVPRETVEAFLLLRSGFGGLKALSDLVWENRQISRERARQAVGIYPNIKPMHRFFAREAAIIHDLSPVLTPQFHNADNIIHFAYRIRNDIETSDHLFCVSDATRQDVHRYFGKPLDQTSVIRLGVEFDPANISAARIANEGLRASNYIAVIGTLEPRKNGRILLDYLTLDPGYALRYDIVFIGRDGWLEEKSRLLRLAQDAGVETDRIIFTGFVSEAEKTALILNSRFCVYPSFFEGFGLPVLEAAALGKITVCSNSSSIPEVAPESSIFFDPTNVHELGEALRIAEKRAAQTRSPLRSEADLMAMASKFGWDGCYAEIAAWINDSR